MSNPIQAMLEAGIIEVTNFPPDSRWHGIAQVSIVQPDGREVRYLKRRFPPDPDDFVAIRVRALNPAERLDHVAAEELGNPEAFWILCDTNGAIFPEELDRSVKITVPREVADANEDR